MTRQQQPATRREAVAGAVAWVLIVQFFVLHLLVQAAWRTPYSWARNDISDLGTTVCGQAPGYRTYVCSPWHSAMNTSFVVLGACVAAGGVLLGLALSRGAAGRLLPWLGGALLALAGAGTVLVGANPGNLELTAHLVGAAAATLCGNAGLLLLGLALRRAGRRAGTVGVAAALLGFAGVLIALAQQLGLFGGLDGWGGAVERVAIFPMLIAMIVIGVSYLTRRPGSGPTR
ncbi:DUF998 domain-containing protein [Amycolatopsis aidingensis]|uniref:DUF998 domain-containing protein n=1 Tax=Amycolatopsis aidingensis TaxID=2842453 RepID=UPI001C0BA738|nr:DUF998 domain-containing protein [Amycolatopsis aidingensis]